MLTALAILVVLVSPLVAIIGPLVLVEGWRRRRDRIVARQIRLTDAIHAELGGRFAPVVEKPAFQPWRVVFPISESRVPEIGRLIDITNRVVGAELRTPADLHIVFTRPAHAA